MTAEPQARHVAVAVLTYRRPDEIAAVLPILTAQAEALAIESDGRAQGSVIVVDNDPEASARPVVERFIATHPAAAHSAAAHDPGATVRYAHEPAPGIAAARNRALDEAAEHDAVVFIDDDARPMPQWLSQMVGTWLADGAAGVAGRIVPEYLGEVDEWIEQGRFFVRATYPTGSAVAAAQSGNLLLDLAALRERTLRFDPRSGLSGGEDTLLTRSLVASGGRIVHCAEAVVVDLVPAARLTHRWCRLRALSHGNTAGLLATGFPERSAGPIERGTVALGGAARVMVGAARAVFGQVAGSPRHQARGQRLVMRGVGLTIGALGWAYHEYARAGVDGKLRRLVRLTAASAVPAAPLGNPPRDDVVGRES